MGVRGLMTCPLFNLDIYIFIYLYIYIFICNKRRLKQVQVQVQVGSLPPSIAFGKMNAGLLIYKQGDVIM